tara:strand:+ start:7583 stop:9811 length:2229 start_codon:yes stop_codon:yes gene_type:complete
MERVIEDFKPYFFIEDNEDKDRIIEAYDDYFHGWSLGDRKGVSLDGRPLIQINAAKPDEIRRMRDLAQESWEGDIVYPDRFLIDTFGVGEMPSWYDNMVRAGGFDLEWNRDEEITAMGFTTDGEVVRQWSWHPTHEGLNALRSEKEMLLVFAEAFKQLDPDIITTWSGNRADWPMIFKRYRHHKLDMDWLSAAAAEHMGNTPPMTHLPRSGVYTEGSQVVLGRLTLDLADRNHGFERVWRDSGNGQLGDRRLGSVGKVAFPNNPEWWKIDFENDPDLEGVCDNHHDLWMNHFDKFLEYHRGDVLLTDRLDQSYHVCRFFMALQQVCGVSFSSVFTVSRFARGPLRRYSNYNAPTGNYKKEGGGYSGGFVAEPKVGRHPNVGVFDYRAMYAEIQRAHNISPDTLRKEAGEGTVELPNGTHWDQTEMGVLPKLQVNLAEARNKAKAQMKKHEPGSNEYAGFNALQLAYKRAAASCYGLMGHKGHGESNLTVAAAITFMGRSLVSRLMDICDDMGYESLAGHTDSAYIGIGDGDGELIAKELTERIQEEFGSDRYVIEYEKFMVSWAAAKKNRNFGWVTWPREGLHCTGFEIKKSNSSPITKRVQGDAFIALCRDGAGLDDINAIVKGAIQDARNGVLDHNDIVMRSRIGMPLKSYQQNGGFWGAAKKYNAREGVKEPFREGMGVPHLYTTNGLEAFQTDEEALALSIDWTTVIEKQIIAPTALIYEIMGWQPPDSSGVKARDLW